MADDASAACLDVLRHHRGGGFAFILGLLKNCRGIMETKDFVTSATIESVKTGFQVFATLCFWVWGGVGPLLHIVSIGFNGSRAREANRCICSPGPS